MKKQIAIWKLIQNSLQHHIPVMLLYVLESKGSSPGRQGFFMAVNKNGEMAGSIGGGIMEHKFVELAKEKLQHQSTKSQIKKQLHDKSATKDRSGMICSGEQTVLISHVKEEEQNVIGDIIQCLEKNKTGTLQLSPKGIQFEEKDSTINYQFEFKLEGNWLYRERIGYKNHLYIIGGGHCALAFSKIMAMMDFYIRIYDERRGLNTMEQNEWVHEKILLNDYEELKELIPSDPDGFVVIMSFGYRTDAVALRSLLNKQYKYLGLLGSKKKIEEMFDQFRQEGVSNEILNSIHSPIGLSIKSQTPEEIAISIAAQIIAIKNV